MAGYSGADRYFGKLLQRPSWVLPFVVFAVVMLASEIQLYPVFVQRTLQALPSSVGARGMAAIQSYLLDDILKQLMILPVRLLISSMIMGVLLATVCGSFRSRVTPRFRHFVALEVRAEYAFALQAVVSAIAIAAGMTPSTLPVTVLDASMLVGSGTADMFGLCQKLNLFSFLYVAALAEGVHGLCLFRRPTAYLMACFCWLVSAIGNAGIIRILSESFGFFG